MPDTKASYPSQHPGSPETNNASSPPAPDHTATATACVPAGVLLAYNSLAIHLRRIVQVLAHAQHKSASLWRPSLEHHLDTLLPDILQALSAPDTQQQSEVFGHLFRIHSLISDANIHLDTPEPDITDHLLSELAEHILLATPRPLHAAAMFSLLLRESKPKPVPSSIPEIEHTPIDPSDDLWNNLLDIYEDTPRNRTAPSQPTPEDTDDELYDRCVELVVAEQRASTSLLQRRLSIGYGRASRLIDLLEARGIISPQSGSSPTRIVLRRIP